MDRLDALEVFLAVADHGSLAEAARRRGRSPAAVTRTLNDLEMRLGARLLVRTTRRVVLTEAGQRMAAQARQLVAAYTEAMAQVAGEAAAPSGTLRISAPLMFGRRHIAPLAAAFLDAYPEMRVELYFSDRIVDLVDEGVDVALRIGELDPSSLVARRLGRVRRVLVASPAYLARAGLPVTPADLAKHEIVAFAMLPGDLRWSFSGADGRVHSVRIRPRVQANQMDVVIEAAIEGRGIAAPLSYQVADALSSGQLVRLLRDFEPPTSPVQFVYPTARLMAPKLRAFLDFAVPRLSALPVLQEP